MIPEGREEVPFKTLERRPLWARLVREIVLDTLALVWPTTCVGCGLADREICDTCRAELLRAPQVLTREIGVRCWAADTYEGVVRSALIALKHGGQLGYARVLGARLRAPLLAAVAGTRGEECGSTQAPVIVAAPSRRARVRARGYRHVELLVRQALAGQWHTRRHALAGQWHTGYNAGRHHAQHQLVQVRALRALSGRRAQNGLDAAARERNARRVEVIRSQSKKIRGREVILVDDVVTTGATLRAAAEALEIAGAHVIAAVVLCAVPRRDEVPL